MPWMLPTVIKNLFSKPATLCYPVVVREPVAGFRGKVRWDGNKCDLCNDCARLCPSGAITVDVPSRQVRYDPLKCIYCANCVDVCLQQAISHDLTYTSPRIHKKQEATVIKHRGFSTNNK